MLYTRKTLADALNKTFKKKSFSKKKTKSKFTQQDIAQYLTYGKLPDKYGGNKLELVEEHGVQFIKVDKEESLWQQK